jgi:hypothetical protein
MEDEYDQPSQFPGDEQTKVPDYSGPVKIKRDYVPKGALKFLFNIMCTNAFI